MRKHTEGPWTPVQGQGAHHRDWYIRAGERRGDGSWPAVAKCCSTGIGARVTVEANAALIAAAPDLLSRLKAATGRLALICDDTDGFSNDLVRDCREAIRKADPA